MSTYAELKAQAEALLAQAEEIRRAEKAKVVEEIRAIMAQHGITVDDLGARARRGGKRAAGASAAKYRGPNGELWSGGPGRRPQWVRDLMAAGEDIEKYRIA